MVPSIYNAAMYSPCLLPFGLILPFLLCDKDDMLTKAQKRAPIITISKTIKPAFLFLFIV